jgi:hypothetical protein
MGRGGTGGRECYGAVGWGERWAARGGRPGVGVFIKNKREGGRSVSARREGIESALREMGRWGMMHDSHTAGVGPVGGGSLDHLDHTVYTPFINALAQHCTAQYSRTHAVRYTASCTCTTLH